MKQIRVKPAIVDLNSPDDQLISKGGEMIDQLVDMSPELHELLDIMCMRKLEMTKKPTAEELELHESWWATRKEALNKLYDEAKRKNA